MTPVDFPYFIFLLALLLVFAGGLLFETALVNAALPRLKAAERKGTSGAWPARRLLERGDQSLGELQTLLIISGSLSVFFCIAVLRDFFPLFNISYGVLFSVLFVAIFFQIVSSIAVALVECSLSDSLLCFLAWPYYILCLPLLPLVYLGSWPGKLLQRFIGKSLVRPKSSAEIALLVTGSEDEVLLDKEEEEMIQGVCEFSDTVAREVMTPRTDIVVIPAEAEFTEVVEIIRESGFSRFPVIEEKVDNVVGTLLARDLMSYMANYLETGKNGFSVKKVMREPYFIPNTKAIDDLLAEFKKRKHHMAVVLDEHGGVDGIVTLEDLIEEIVGEIFDESDLPESEITIDGQGDVMLDGGVLVDELNERFSLKIPEGDYDTVAGYLLARLGRMPVKGDVISIFDGTEVEEKNISVPLARLLIESLDGHRIETVKLLDLPSQAEDNAINS